MKLGAFVLNRPKLYGLAGQVGRATLRWLPRFLVYGPWNAWGKQRDLPPPPRKSFRDEFRRRKAP
jgi:L-lactate dehydrogenase complex protein LldF